METAKERQKNRYEYVRIKTIPAKSSSTLCRRHKLSLVFVCTQRVTFINYHINN